MSVDKTMAAEAGVNVSAKPKHSAWTRLLILLGLRSQCCGAKLYNWSVDKAHCTDCGQRV